MIAVLPFCPKDVDLAKQLLAWIADLGECSYHSCMLAVDSQVKEEDRLEVKKLANRAFGHNWAINIAIGETPNYAIACNRMFERASNQIKETCKDPFLWLEPDAVPVKKGWLDTLEEAYRRQPKRYMGAIVKSEGALAAPADVKQHLAMVAVYPANAHTDLAEFFNANRAFDLASHEFLPPRAMNTRLIHQFFPERDKLITFKTERAEDDPVNVRTPASLWPEAVLFHQSKDGSLIKVLRDKLILPKDLSPDVRRMKEAALAK